MFKYQFGQQISPSVVSDSSMMSADQIKRLNFNTKMQSETMSDASSYNNFTKL